MRLALGCLAALLTLALAACSRDLPTGGDRVPLNVEMRLDPEAPMGTRPPSIDSVWIRVYDTGNVEDLMIANATIVPDTTTRAFVASFGVPYARQYRVSAAVFGSRARRADPFDVTGYGIQFFGESAVDAGLSGIGDVRIDLRDVVPNASLEVASSLIHWPAVPFAASYDVFNLSSGQLTTLTDTLFQVGPMVYVVRANLYDGDTSAYGEYVYNNFRVPPRP